MKHKRHYWDFKCTWSTEGHIKNIIKVQNTQLQALNQQHDSKDYKKYCFCFLITHQTTPYSQWVSVQRIAKNMGPNLIVWQIQTKCMVVGVIVRAFIHEDDHFSHCQSQTANPQMLGAPKIPRGCLPHSSFFLPHSLSYHERAHQH